MGKKILIADDEPNIVVSLEFLMKQRGHEVRVANDRGGCARRGAANSGRISFCSTS